MNLRHLSDPELLADLSTLIGSSRELLAKLVGYLAEVEDRRLHAKAGYTSLFDFCVRHLGMSEGEAYRRILAARLGRKFPIVTALLASGAVHLSALELLRDHLTEENHAELLEAASGKSKREVQQMVATRFPQPNSPTKIRKLPARRPVGARPAPIRVPVPEPAPEPEPASVPACASAPAPEPEPASAPAPAPARPSPRPRLEPLSETRYKVQLTVSADLRDKLELARDLMSHANPTRDLEPILERAVNLLLADLEKTKLGKTQRPRRKPPEHTTRSGCIATAARRETLVDEPAKRLLERRARASVVMGLRPKPPDIADKVRGALCKD
jgi:hypothetical protein